MTDHGATAALRAAIYARVSTAEQVDGTSLGTQCERCSGYVAAQGWTLAGEYIDAGVSGADESRPELDRLAVAVRRGELDVVIVAKLDRLGRTMRGLTALLAGWDERGVRLVSVAESFDSASPSGRLMRNMLGAFAEFERERIAERTMDGIEAVAASGGWPGGPPPFGWRLERRDGRTELALDDREAAVLRRAVDLVVRERLSTWQAVRALNAESLHPRSRPRDAGHWTHRSLRQMLRNSDHWTGTWTYRRRGPRRQKSFLGPPLVVAIPPLLDDADLQLLRQRLAETSTPAPRQDLAPQYLLSGRITSPHGAPMHGIRRRDRDSRVYCCSTAPGTADGPHCDCRRVNTEVVESMMWADLRALVTDPERLRRMAEDALGRADQADGSSTENTRTLARKVTEAEQAMARLVVEYASAGMDASVVQHATAAMREQLDELRRRHARAVEWQAANRQIRDRTERVWELANQAAATMDASDPATRRRLVDLLDVRVQVTGWHVCESCAGKGKLRDPRPPGERRHGNTGLNCPSCHGHKWVPEVTVSGVLPVPSEPSQPDVPVPFRICRAG